MNILEEAQELTSNDRNKDYGHPKDFFENVGQGWDVIFQKGVTPRGVGLAMIWYKVCREINKPKRDNMVDVAGYARTIEMLDEDIHNPA